MVGHKTVLLHPVYHPARAAPNANTPDALQSCSPAPALFHGSLISGACLASGFSTPSEVPPLPYHPRDLPLLLFSW